MYNQTNRGFISRALACFILLMFLSTVQAEETNGAQENQLYNSAAGEYELKGDIELVVNQEFWQTSSDDPLSIEPVWTKYIWFNEQNQVTEHKLFDYSSYYDDDATKMTFHYDDDGLLTHYFLVEHLSLDSNVDKNATADTKVVITNDHRSLPVKYEYFKRSDTDGGSWVSDNRTFIAGYDKHRRVIFNLIFDLTESENIALSRYYYGDKGHIKESWYVENFDLSAIPMQKLPQGLEVPDEEAIDKAFLKSLPDAEITIHTHEHLEYDDQGNWIHRETVNDSSESIWIIKRNITYR